MKYTVHAYPRFSACGLNCGLCPRHYTDGSSRCPGCAGAGFDAVRPSCGTLSCCQRRGIAFCSLCEEYPCPKIAKATGCDSFITHLNMHRDLETAREIGIDAYAALLDEKIALLWRLLAEYDDGRRKSFYCNAVNLLDTSDVRQAMARIEADTQADMPPKARAALAVGALQAVADARGVSLKLRR